MPKASGILFCGGGTGGHVLPGLAVASAMRARGERNLRWIGDPDRIEAKLVPAQGIPLLPFGLGRPRLWQPRWIVSAFGTVLSCIRELSNRPPRAVVALGGYAALVPGLLAPLMRRPLVVMEQNARAGKTNRLLGRFSDRVVTQFAEATATLPGAKVRRLGNPVRAIRRLPRGGSGTLTVLVVGGSLAAKSLNDLIVAAAGALAKILDLHLIHLAGEDDAARCRAAYAAAGLSAEVHGFWSDMPGLYERIDLAIARAGATTVAELCSAGIGALYIPLPWAADDHQTANARAMAVNGGAEVLAQSAATPEAIATWIARLAADRAAVATMGDAAARLARPHAAAAVARLVNGLTRRHAGRAASRARFRAGLLVPQPHSRSSVPSSRSSAS